MNENILTTNCCRFIDQSPSALESLQILHFIRETKQATLKNWKNVAYYQLCYVLNGNAILKTEKYSFNLKKGTLFLLFPGTPYMIDAKAGFVYTYIGFLGKRANQLTDKYHLSVSNCIFYDLDNLEQLWIDALSMETETLALSAESVLLFSFAALGKNFYHHKNEFEQEKSNIKKIKDYIDINFANQDLSLQTLSENLLYSPKYISTIFKKYYKISFKAYLNMFRVQNACALIEKENYCVKEIAFLCGFNDPLYFSKTFKKVTGITPSEQIEDSKRRKNIPIEPKS